MDIYNHLFSRHWNPYKQPAYVDPEEIVATFPLFNLSGQMVGYQAYRPLADKVQRNHVYGRYYTFLGEEGEIQSRSKKKLGIWGLESLQYPGPVFLSEGIFDAIRIWNHGYASLALLSNDPKPLRNQLLLLNRRLIAVCDNDEAGRRLAKMGHTSVTVTGHDLGDSTQDEVLEVIERGLATL